MNIAIINNKGGTGKTTTSVNLSAALANLGYRVLLVDLDAQASASFSLGVKYSELTPSASEVLLGSTPAERAIRNSCIERLDLITGSMELASTDLIISNIPGREALLADRLASIINRYDFIFYDCPPSLSLLSINALVASDCFLVTVTAEYLALEGLISLMTAIDNLKKGMGIEPQLLGILFTMVNRQLKSSKSIINLVQKYYGSDVFSVIIKKNVSLVEAPSYGADIFTYAPKSQGAFDYAMLATDFIERCNLHNESRDSQIDSVS